MQKTQVWSLSLEDHLEKEMATHSSTLAWKIPWTKEPGRLQSMGSQRVRHDWSTSLHFTHKLLAIIFFLALVPTFLSMEIHSTWDIAIKMLSHACFTPVNSICSQYMYYIWWIYTVHIGERNDNPLQYSCLENPMDRRAWQATVHGIPKSQTQLNTHAHTLFI